MTEKRFSLIKDTGTDECYSDNIYDNGTYIGAIEGGSEMICYLLNEQNETITKLKSELLSKDDLIQQLKNILEEDYYTKWKKTNLNYIRVCEELAEENRAYEKLSEENEKLKSTIKDVVGLLSEEVDVFSDKALEHDLIAYRELQQLDNKDAYYLATSTKKAIEILKGDGE